MTQLRIDSTKLSESGKSVVIKAGGGTYYTKTDQGLLGKDGCTINAEEVSDSEYKGKTMTWINKWSMVGGAPAVSPAQAATILHQPAIWQPMASNICAAAIAAGLIKEPPQIRAWVFAVKGAIEAAINDDIGF